MIWVVAAVATFLGMHYRESLLRRVLLVFQAGLVAHMVINSDMTKFSMLNLVGAQIKKKKKKKKKNRRRGGGGEDDDDEEEEEEEEEERERRE